MRQIIITRNEQDNFSAHLKDHPVIQASGETVESAIGRLVMTNQNLFPDLQKIYFAYTENKYTKLPSVVRLNMHSPHWGQGNTQVEAVGFLVTSLNILHPEVLNTKIAWNTHDAATIRYLCGDPEYRN